MVKYYLADRNPFQDDPKGDIDVESDCEGDSSEFANEAPVMKMEREVIPRAVLTTGSFSACVHKFSLSILSCLENCDRFPRWKSLFFYRCTDEISFAPLRFQGIDSRSDYIRERTVAVAPPPCSPKSVYILANLVRVPSVGGCSLY